MAPAIERIMPLVSSTKTDSKLIKHPHININKIPHNNIFYIPPLKNLND